MMLPTLQRGTNNVGWSATLLTMVCSNMWYRGAGVLARRNICNPTMMHRLVMLVFALVHCIPLHRQFPQYERGGCHIQTLGAERSVANNIGVSRNCATIWSVKYVAPWCRECECDKKFAIRTCVSKHGASVKYVGLGNCFWGPVAPAFLRKMNVVVVASKHLFGGRPIAQTNVVDSALVTI